MLRSLAGAFVLSLVTGTAASGQAGLLVELGSETRHVWHGIPRAAGALTNGAVSGNLNVAFLTVSAGISRYYELDDADPTELTENAGTGIRLGEQNIWARVAAAAGPLRLSAVTVRYDYGGTFVLRGDPSTTYAVGARAAIVGHRTNPAIEAWWDVKRVGGVYLQASTRLPMMAWPFQPFIFAYLDAEAGLNMGQGPDPAHPPAISNYAERGVTHLAGGLTVQFSKGLPGVLSAGFRGQLNLDPATRFNGTSRESDFNGWIWTKLSIHVFKT